MIRGKFMSYAEKAKKIFEEGYNCSQAVFSAFSDIMNIDEETAKRISTGLGGGVGRMREVCGAVSGAAMVLGFVYGGENGEDKKSAYEKVQEFAEVFKKDEGSIICREILGLDKKKRESATPDERTAEYYRVRPCAEKVYEAARIVEEMLKDTK